MECLILLVVVLLVTLVIMVYLVATSPRDCTLSLEFKGCDDCDRHGECSYERPPPTPPNGCS
jgi:hypothetical protein